jgi:hypothetical protein
MTQHPIDFDSVRVELRAMNRGNLLIIAERAIELLPATQLSALLGNFVQLAARPAEASNAPASQLDEVRAFYDAAMAGKYYETVEINNRGRQEQSESTDAFISEFDRLLRRCIRAAGQEMHLEARSNFELLFGLLRRIDDGNDDVLFFADDGSASDVGVNWRTALPAYFSCLAKTSSPEEFARTVDFSIEDFSPYDRPHYLTVARNVANVAQRITLDVLKT